MARFTVEFEIKEGNVAQRFTKTHLQKCANKGLPIEIKVEDKGLGKAKLVRELLRLIEVGASCFNHYCANYDDT